MKKIFLIVIMFFASVSLAKISKDTKISVCLGQAIDSAISSLGQDDPQVARVDVFKDASLPANQVKYQITLTENDDHDYYRYLVTSRVSSRPTGCEILKVEVVAWP